MSETCTAHAGQQYPLTHPQKRIWYIEQLYPDTSVYIIGGLARIKGRLNAPLLVEAINLFVARNQAVRLRLCGQADTAHQYVAEHTRFEPDYRDLSACDAPEAELQEHVARIFRTPFQLYNHQLFYFALFKLSENETVFLVKFHHIIADGWSIGLTSERIFGTYARLARGEDAGPSVDYVYTDYIQREQEYLATQRFEKDRQYWHGKFQPLVEGAAFASEAASANVREFELEQDVSEALKAFSKDTYSLSTILLATYALYVHRVLQQDTLIIGLPVLNRYGKPEKSTVGMFTGLLPLLSVLDTSSTIREFIAAINRSLSEDYRHQKYPYDLLVGDLGLQRLGGNSLFDVCFNYYNTRLSTQLDDICIQNEEYYSHYQTYSLQLIIKEWSDSGRLTLCFTYKSADYSAAQIEQMYASIKYLLEQVIRSTDQKISALRLLPAAEHDALVRSFNATGVPFPHTAAMHQLFEAQVDRTPDRVALRFAGQSLTYAELNGRANQLARALVERGIGPETVVGLITTHSLETVIGILGILKAGAAYLPIDAKEPAERINFMLADAAPRLLLVNTRLDEAVTFSGPRLELTDPALYTGATDNLLREHDPGYLAYIIYTSGSTGIPKGTMIAHQQLVNYIWWAQQVYIDDPSDVFALYSSLAFDLTITSIFTPLVAGNSIVIYDDSEDEYVLFRILREQRATILKLTPAHLSLLKDGDYQHTSVKRLIVGGEDLKVSLARKIQACFGGQVDILNEYGPTETVVGCMLYRYDATQDRLVSVPIGVPAHNVQVYVLDRCLQPLPLYTIGELYVSGAGVARGYLKRPALTAERFIPDPFTPGQRMYKTGDLARFVRPGCIEYAGRADRQVKVRAHRIELGEIEAGLEAHPLVKQAVVVYREATTAEGQLYAYVVASAPISAAELRAHLQERVPAYMIPSRLIQLDTLPLTGNGKIQYAALPDPALEESPLTVADLADSSVERVLLQTVADVLQLDALRIDDHFFHLGGDSIKAIQITARLSQHGLSLKARDILAYPTLRQMALCITAAGTALPAQEAHSGSIATPPIIAWFLAQNFLNPHFYNQSIFLQLKRSIDVADLTDVMTQLVLHHDALRINYDPQADSLFYNARHLHEPCSVTVHDLAADPAALQQERMRRICEETKAGLDLEQDLLVKACLFDLGADQRYLFLTLHHVIVDGVSWRILCNDLHLLLTQRLGGQQFQLPPKSHSYQLWAEQLAAAAHAIAEDELAYWQAQIEQQDRVPAGLLAATALQDCATARTAIDAETTAQLLTQANAAFGTEPQDLLLVAFAQAASVLLGHADLPVMLEGHGRETLAGDLDLSRTVGWFTSMYPVHVQLSGAGGAEDIKAIKEQLRRVPNKGIGFGILRHRLGRLDIDESRYIRFNYLGEIGSGFTTDLFELALQEHGSESDPRNHLPCRLDINCYIFQRRLIIVVTYKRHEWPTAAIQSFLTTWSDHLHSVIRLCLAQHQVEFTPSDFDTVDLSQSELDMLLG